MFFILLIQMPNFVPIRCYYYMFNKLIFLCIILDYKNLQFKKLIFDKEIDFDHLEILKARRI